MSTNSLICKGLTKEYTGGVGALGIDISIAPGEIVGFIGPNGAGKTTTIRMLMGFIEPELGSLEVFGVDWLNEINRVQFMHRIGFLPSDTNYYVGYTARRLIGYSASLSGGKDAYDFALQLAQKLDLDINRPVQKLSTGNQRKVGLVLAAMNKPELMILDEPTSGFDPLIQQQALEIISAVRERGGSVFLSSHVLSEVEQICDRVIMIKDGKIILEDSTQNILERAMRRFRLRELSDKLRKELIKMAEVEKIVDAGVDVLIYSTTTGSVVDVLRKSGVDEFWIERPKLEEMFMDYYA